MTSINYYFSNPPKEYQYVVVVFHIQIDDVKAVAVYILGVVMVVVLAIVDVFDGTVVAVVVVVVSDSVLSLFPEVFQTSRYCIVVERPGTVVLSRLWKYYRLGGCDLYRDLTTSLLMCRPVSGYFYILCPLVFDPTVSDRQSPVSQLVALAFSGQTRYETSSKSSQYRCYNGTQKAAVLYNLSILF